MVYVLLHIVECIIGLLVQSISWAPALVIVSIGRLRRRRYLIQALLFLAALSLSFVLRLSLPLIFVDHNDLCIGSSISLDPLHSLRFVSNYLEDVWLLSREVNFLGLVDFFASRWRVMMEPLSWEAPGFCSCSEGSPDHSVGFLTRRWSAQGWVKLWQTFSLRVRVYLLSF